MALVSFKHFCLKLRGCIILHQRGAFSVARFDNQGNAKAFMEETGNRTGSTLFLCLEKTHIGKLMLDEPVEHAKLIQICLHNGITWGEIQSCFSPFCACLHNGRLGFLFAVGMSDVVNGISIIILSEFYINEKYITHTDTVFSGNFLRRRTCPAAR